MMSATGDARRGSFSEFNLAWASCTIRRRQFDRKIVTSTERSACEVWEFPQPQLELSISIIDTGRKRELRHSALVSRTVEASLGTYSNV